MSFSVIVKATYSTTGELRKLTFPSFPTYEQLYNQLYRVFPISNNYFLSKLLFSPDSSKASILIGTEVHNADEFARCTAPYKNGLWSNAMLRFTVFDETPHKLPAGFVANNTSADTFTGAGTPNPFISMSHIPPPPIILSSAASSTQASMDVDATLGGRYSPGSTSTLKPQHQHAPQSATAGTPATCCAVSQGKVEMEEIVAKFKDDLDRILRTSLGTPTTGSTSLPFMPSLQPTPPASSFCLFKYCTTCAKIFQGPWYACDKCSIVVCLGCHENQSNTFCVAAMGSHIMKKEVSAAPLPPLPVPAVTQVPEAPAPPAPPVIHRGVICDMCDNVIEGIRHKCLDCADYDLCTPCIASGSAERHNPFHEFLEIKEPGRVIVHTVYSGDGERDTPAPARPPPAAPQPQAEEQPVIHFATCNLCDSRIRGDRYKCADCPDFDTCSNCFRYDSLLMPAVCQANDLRSITREQHPHHAFIKLSKASDYIRRDNPVAPMHFVTCDGCKKAIYGIRYKCMHPECPDFDLCDSCEAFPIPVHPDNHPLLKMRSANTVVPTVYRVGQTTLIDREELQRGRSPAPTPSARSRSPSFERGYIANPGRSHTMPASFFDSAPTPDIPPPSPFFFRSESSRSSSPAMMLPTTGQEFDPLPPSPMMMPGGLYDGPAFARQPQPARPVFPVYDGQYSHSHEQYHPVYENPLFATPQPTASRFSHSPSPSPPLFKPPSSSFNHSLAALLNGYESENEGEKVDDLVVPATQEQPAPAAPAPALELRASFVNDVTLPDGQIFPPGAEFMKCWQIVNNGSLEWPAGTELVYVAGEQLAREHGGPARVLVGAVKVGAEIELWTGELKAPEAPGRYVSYWRLRDGQGQLFGDSLWIEYVSCSINVAETRSNESSLSSSSIIVMPQKAQSAASGSGVQVEREALVSHGDVEEDDSSEHDSDASSVSLISVPTSEDEEWASVAAVEEPQAQRYVVLYDDASSESSDDE
ncbi:hypothetical protein DFH07DRAFT_745724 [Mycena maculata]|uniref:ZZ-type domain-containing protein n=1 Tax=Mycena maculata TaxID=230809 RepID=A0AAD7IYM8_9AGAR|nr:hypothetical protein DFH07DRAFT_745724 [Mycena maculata]